MLDSSLASATSPITVLKFGGGLVQHQAIALACSDDVPMTIAAPLSRLGTRVTS